MDKTSLILIAGLTLSLLSCETPIIKPEIETISVAHITHSTALIRGRLISDGGSYAEKKGAVYGTFPGPAITDSSVWKAWYPDDYTIALTDLLPGTTYYVRAYTENSKGIAYGNELSFNTKPANTFTDPRDGNAYNEVAIGSQTWMGENMRYLMAEEYCKPVRDEYTEIDLPQMGYLYNVEVCDEVCPSGWHLPTDEDWKVLEQHLGMSENDLDETGLRGGREAYALRQPGTRYWKSDHDSITNSSGFTILPAGYAGENGINSNYGRRAHFWTAENGNGNRWNRWLNELSYSSNTGIERVNFSTGENISMNSYFSVRCLKND